MAAPKASIDFETRSAEDLRAAGAHRYAQHPSTEVMMMGWSIDDAEPELWVPGQPFPEALRLHILAGGRVEAWNAQFERVIWPIMVREHGAPKIDMRQWYCTMVRAYLMGYPGKLDAVGPCLGLGQVKDEAGHRLMLQVSKPRKVWREDAEDHEAAALKARDPAGGLAEYTSYFDAETGDLVVCQWWVDSDRIGRIQDYCKQDVRVEMAASERLDPIPPGEHAAWLMDQRINDRGYYLDRDLVDAARALVKPATAQANKELAEVTGGELKSVTKPNEIRAWLNAQLNLELTSIDKKTLDDLLHQIENGWEVSDQVVEVIKLRRAAAKTSTAKLNSMVKGVCPDGRIHGGLQFAGAGRTNRWAGRIVQPHNFPRPPKWAPMAVDEILARLPVEILEMLYDLPLEVISAILRSCISAEPGRELHVADYNAIECRVTAWLAGAALLLDAYRTGKDPYRMQAATVFGVKNWQEIDKESDMRQLGKKIILGCGFGMGVPKFHQSCREDGLYIDRELAQRAVDAYREDNWEIKEAWYELDRAAKRAVKGEAVPCLDGKVWFYRDAHYLRCRLPSGRVLSYAQPRLQDATTPWGSPTEELLFWGWNGQKNRMEWQKLYGGRIMENVVQATARDVLADAMVRLDADAWHIILSVHDEILNEEDQGKRTLADMIQIMEQPPRWAPDLPLKAEGWTGIRYRK